MFDNTNLPPDKVAIKLDEVATTLGEEENATLDGMRRKYDEAMQQLN